MRVDFRFYDRKMRCPKCDAHVKVKTGFLRSENQYSHVIDGFRCFERQLRKKGKVSPIFIERSLTKEEVAELREEIKGKYLGAQHLRVYQGESISFGVHPAAASFLKQAFDAWFFSDDNPPKSTFTYAFRDGFNRWVKENTLPGAWQEETLEREVERRR